MQKIKTISRNLGDYIVYAFLSLAILFVVFALIAQLFFVFLEFSGRSETAAQIARELSWKFDGTFKNDPNNIFYNADEHVYVESVVNNVKIGKLAGNRNLEFGVKNILEEFLQDKGYDLTPSAQNKLKVEIVYLDVLTTKKNVSVFHKNEEEVVIRMKGVLYKDGKKEKEIIVEEGSSEISMSSLIVDEGGQFNQTSLSNAIKKTCDKLVQKLFN
jgi:hypothetical protein